MNATRPLLPRGEGWNARRTRARIDEARSRVTTKRTPRSSSTFRCPREWLSASSVRTRPRTSPRNVADEAKLAFAKSLVDTTEIPTTSKGSRFARSSALDSTLRPRRRSLPNVVLANRARRVLPEPLIDAIRVVHVHARQRPHRVPILRVAQTHAAARNLRTLVVGSTRRSSRR